jgi:hypothetical protein
LLDNASTTATAVGNQWKGSSITRTATSADQEDVDILGTFGYVECSRGLEYQI